MATRRHRHSARPTLPYAPVADYPVARGKPAFPRRPVTPCLRQPIRPLKFSEIDPDDLAPGPVDPSSPVLTALLAVAACTQDAPAPTAGHPRRADGQRRRRPPPPPRSRPRPPTARPPRRRSDRAADRPGAGRRHRLRRNPRRPAVPARHRQDRGGRGVRLHLPALRQLRAPVRGVEGQPAGRRAVHPGRRAVRRLLDAVREGVLHRRGDGPARQDPRRDVPRDPRRAQPAGAAAADRRDRSRSSTPSTAPIRSSSKAP